jgi:hypothetical protein
MAVPGVCGMRLETPVRVTSKGGEMLYTTLPELTVIEGLNRSGQTSTAKDGRA